MKHESAKEKIDQLEKELKLINTCWQTDIKEIIRLKEVIQSNSFMKEAFDANQNLIAERDKLKESNVELLEALENFVHANAMQNSNILLVKIGQDLIKKVKSL